MSQLKNIGPQLTHRSQNAGGGGDLNNLYALVTTFHHTPIMCCSVNMEQYIKLGDWGVPQAVKNLPFPQPTDVPFFWLHQKALFYA